MLLVCLLVISLVLLLVFSMSRENGKNTKFARKNANTSAQNRESAQSIDTSKGIEIK
jgi:hypothetical protein